LKNLIKHQEVTKCPLCRDSFLEDLKQLFGNSGETESESDFPSSRTGERYPFPPFRARGWDDIPLFVPKRHQRPVVLPC
jgi:hypothetical protein